MEAFVVSALKYRPQQFADVVGQQAITQTLENAIAKDQLPQALLFCGPRGVGKTTCARILAKKSIVKEIMKENKISLLIFLSLMQPPIILLMTFESSMSKYAFRRKQEVIRFISLTRFTCCQLQPLMLF